MIVLRKLFNIFVSEMNQMFYELYNLILRPCVRLDENVASVFLPGSSRFWGCDERRQSRHGEEPRFLCRSGMLGVLEASDADLSQFHHTQVSCCPYTPPIAVHSIRDERSCHVLHL